jgi:AcrR family transcriptional regulator
MPRDGEKVRRRLQEAALELYQEGGYDGTTAAEIAAKAGVTGRTFFRHFADKREVLFGGEEEFAAALTGAILNAPKELAPLETLLHAFRAVEPIFVENRSFSTRRQMVIDSNPALQERAQAKRQALIATVVSALVRRDVPSRLARLAAQLGMAAMNCAVSSWFESGSADLDGHLTQAFEDVRGLSSFSAKPTD